ncbi:hypothetical protein SCHPADRAFT_930086 [Schizopora paradoxa]|uniref:F-box domain-containing protein n=1 Tax=Schizopora paradoxa TaxID=27342 RepID=A0A0H2S2H6_9AGAM|nr:hypothetical protein SCHPADRAFT_930086 [Schizopora paradoxa]
MVSYAILLHHPLLAISWNTGVETQSSSPDIAIPSVSPPFFPISPRGAFVDDHNQMVIQLEMTRSLHRSSERKEENAAFRASSRTIVVAYLRQLYFTIQDFSVTISLLRTRYRRKMPPKFLTTPISEDLLSIIFEYVFSASSAKFEVETTPQNLPAISILKLSHVNRQFRHTSLSNPHLWTYIAGEVRYPTMGLVNACIERSRSVPLTVNLYVYINPFYGPSCDTLLEAARPHAHRWRTVHFRFVHIRTGPECPRAFAGVLRGLDDLWDISTPALEHLALYDDPATLLKDELDFIESWNTPALRSLVTEFCFPSKLPPESFQAITSLEMKSSLPCADFCDLLTLLRASKMPYLTDLILHFDHHENVRQPGILSPAPNVQPDFPLPSVQRLHIMNYSKVNWDIHSDGSERPYFLALSFPNVRELSITLVAEALDYGRPRSFVYLHESLDRIFKTTIDPSEDRRFPLLSRLHINICSYGFETDVLAGGLASFELRKHLLPSLEELYINSNMPLDISTYCIAKCDQPALKRIEVDMPGLGLGSASESSVDDASFHTAPELWTWLRTLASSLIAQGVWHEFEELVLTERVYGAESDGSGVKIVERVFPRDMLVQVFKKPFDKEPQSG